MAQLNVIQLHSKAPYHTASPDVYKTNNMICNIYCSIALLPMLSQRASLVRALSQRLLRVQARCRLQCLLLPTNAVIYLESHLPNKEGVGVQM